MPDTPRMSLPYPNKDATDWYDQMSAFFRVVDGHMYAHREDRNLLMYSTATWSWDAGTGVLSWDDAFWVTGAQTGGRWKVQAGSLSIEDGYLMVVSIPRYPQAEDVVDDVEARAACEQTDEGFVVCVRKGNSLFFRTGVVLTSGSSVDIFDVWGSGGGSVVDHGRHMHDNGIVRSSTSSAALALSVVDGGGLADDVLRSAAVPAGDEYMANGTVRTEPSADYDFTNPVLPAGGVELRRAAVGNSGDPMLPLRASYTQPAALDQLLVVNCSRGIAGGVKNLVFTSVVAANFWKVEFDGGAPFLAASVFAPPTGVYRLYSQDGVNWIDLWIPGTFDWTKVDVGGPHTVVLSFFAEVDEDMALLIGSAVAWDNAGIVTWGYGTTKETVDQRYFGNLGTDSARDDLLQTIAEAALVSGLSGVVFDRKAYWTGNLGGGGGPMMQWPQQNFSFDYASPNVTVEGGKLLVDGELVDVESATIQLALTAAGVDYYLWWDRSDEAMKITPATAFPTIQGSANPLMWILGGSIGLPQYLAGDLDKPCRGVPLYVFRRGASDTQIDEGTLCDLRRNVTKAALKNHISVGFRPDWGTATFGATFSVPDINQSEAEFGCLDAAFRYANAVPAELGGGEWGTNAAKLYGRVVEVVGYSLERRALTVPRDTQVVGAGYASVHWLPQATPDTSDGWPSGVMLRLGDTSSLKDLLLTVDGELGSRAVVGLIGDTIPSDWGDGDYQRAVLENCTLYSSGRYGLHGMVNRTDPGYQVVVSRCAIVGENPYAHGGAWDSIGAMIDEAVEITFHDCVLHGWSYGLYVSTKGEGLELQRCTISADKSGAAPSDFPNGCSLYVASCNRTAVRGCHITTGHARAVQMGGGPIDIDSVLEDCVIESTRSLVGSAAMAMSFVSVVSDPVTVRGIVVHGPVTANTESTLRLLYVDSGQKVAWVYGNHLELDPNSDPVGWDDVLWVRGLIGVEVEANYVFGLVDAGNGGLTVGVEVAGGTVARVSSNVVKNCAGIGIDVDAQVEDCAVTGNRVEGGGGGNGIRARGLVEGNHVEGVRSWGISVYPKTRVLGNEVLTVSHASARPEGTGTYEEWSAWGIRLTPDAMQYNIYDVQVKDNRVDGVSTAVQNAANGIKDLCCGIGPAKAIGGAWYLYSEDVDVSGNVVRDVSPLASMTNVEFYGIALAHPVESVRCDLNDIHDVGAEDDADYSWGIGAIQGTAAAIPDQVNDVSICGNMVRWVVGELTSVGIYAGSGSRVSVDDNQISDVWCDGVTGVRATCIYYVDVGAQGGIEDSISVCRNQMGISEDSPPAGYVCLRGIHVTKGNAAVDVNDIVVTGNQLRRLLKAAADAFIQVQTGGKGIVISGNEHRFGTGESPQRGIRVSASGTGPEGVAVFGNVSYGEYTNSFLSVGDGTVVSVHDNVQKGFADASAYGTGILLTACADIDVHDNLISGCTPDTGHALVRIVDCAFGSVHDNVLKGYTGGNIDSLRFEDSAANPPYNCVKLHIHDNKIDPHGAAAGPYDIGFYPAGGTGFGTDMTIWNNVFGDTTTTGTENFSASLWYVPAPAANNWTGAAFV